jgi:hypothetical protein
LPARRHRQTTPLHVNRCAGLSDPVPLHRLLLLHRLKASPQLFRLLPHRRSQRRRRFLSRWCLLFRLPRPGWPCRSLLKLLLLL